MENIDPMEPYLHQCCVGSRKFYKEGFNILLDMTHAKPNKAHKALAELERLGYIKGIITQNIEHLHYMAGSKYILEVHGNTREGYCTSCGDVVI